MALNALSIRNRRLRHGALLLCGTTLAFSTSALAQQSDPTTAPPTLNPPAAQPPTQASEDGIADIVVTARFRSETLQNTPVAVSALNSKLLTNSVVTNLQSIQKYLPNVQLSQINYAGQALGASIRGISFADLEKTFDPAIGVAIDGVFLGTNTGGNFNLNDIESIEVLRGPQGTLYGRNTIGGTISVRRTTPTGIFGVKGTARYSSFNNLDLDAVLNLPKIGDALSIKLFGQRRRGDSPTRNRYTGKREPGRKYYTFGGTVLADLGETSILATAEYQKDRSRYSSAVNMTLGNGLPFGAGGTICDYTRAVGLGDRGCASQGYLLQDTENYKLANTSIPFKSYLSGWAGSVELKSKIGGFNLTAITGYRDTKDSLLEENTGTAPISYSPVPGAGIPLFVAARDQKYKQFSQEVRIQGNITDRIDLVAGAYYLHTDYAIRPYPYNGARAGTAYLAVPLFPPLVPAPLFINAPIQSFTAAQKLDSYAIFAESIIKVVDNVRLTVGGRYTSETKKFDINQTVPAAAAFTASGKKSWRDPTGRVILDWKPNPDTLLYASWSRGFRSGGWNGRATTATAIGPYDPERVDSYEAGLKASFLDGKLRFNPTVFLANYNNKQEEFLRPGAGGQGTETVVQNAATARVKGIEMDIQARPVRELTLRAAASYLDAEYRAFPIPNLATAAPNDTIDIRDIANFRRAPKYTLTTGLDYDHAFDARNSVNLALNYGYISSYKTSPRVDLAGLGRDTIVGHTAFDASLAFVHKGDIAQSLRVAAYVKDLFHGGNRITNTLDAGVFYFGAVNPNREMGVEATIRF